MKWRWLKSLAFFLLGALLGAAGINVLIGHQVDRLAMTNRILQTRLEDTTVELQRIKESSSQKEKYTVNAVETYLLLDSREGLTEYDDIRLKLEVNEKIKIWLNPLMGQEVKTLDILWIPSVVDNREIEVNGNHYQLKTYLAIISEKITLYLKVTLQKKEEN